MTERIPTGTVAPTEPATQAIAAEVISVKKIWDHAPHNAFTDLIWFKDKWICTFREGQAHVSPDGAIRVLSSIDGDTWESAALITSDKGDLRDPKMSITREGKLMIVTACALADPGGPHHQSMTWFSDDGITWSNATEVGDPNFWLWRVTWFENVAYCFAYTTDAKTNASSLRLYTSTDGRKFDTLIENAFSTDAPNETTLLFDIVGHALCITRREEGSKHAALGTCQPPYDKWQWSDLKVSLGGPNMIRLPDGRLVVAARLTDQNVRTALLWLDPQNSTLKEFLTLPSGGDTSYAGLAYKDDILWISYYSSHEGKTAIYLAKVKFPPAQ